MARGAARRSLGRCRGDSAGDALGRGVPRAGHWPRDRAMAAPACPCAAGRGAARGRRDGAGPAAQSGARRDGAGSAAGARR